MLVHEYINVVGGVPETYAVNGITYKKIMTGSPDLYPGGLFRENTSTGEVWYRDLVVYRSPDDTVERLAFQFYTILQIC